MLKFDKKFLIGFVALIAVIMFLLEPFQWGSGASRSVGPAPHSSRNISGTAIFNGTIRTYDPVLLIPANTTASIVDQVRMHNGVKAIRTDPRYPEYLIIDTETRDDVYPTAVWLRSFNATSLSVANIAVNKDIQVETASGIVNATLREGVVRVVAEPILDVDSEVTVYIVAVVNNHQIVEVTSAKFLTQNLDLELDGSVAGLDCKIYTYSIPWEKRNSLDDLGRYGAVNYKKIDSIIFNPPLDVSQILAKKQFPYILYIDASSAQVDPSFDNVTLLQANFQDISFVLPPSELTIITNQTLDLPFASNISYRYVFTLQNASYDFSGVSPMLVDTEGEYEINSTIKLNVSVTVLGNKVISVRHVSLPS